MVPIVWIVVAFLAGAAVGALLATMYRLATLSRMREEFRAELLTLIEASPFASPDTVVTETKRPHRAA